LLYIIIMPIFLDSNTNSIPYLNLNPILGQHIPNILAEPISNYYELNGVHVPYPSSIEISSQHKFTDDKEDIIGLLGIVPESGAAKLNLERFGPYGYLNLNKEMRNESLADEDIREALRGEGEEWKENTISFEDQKLILMQENFDTTMPYLRPDNLSLLYQRSPKRMLKTNILLKCITMGQLSAAKDIIAFLNIRQLPRPLVGNRVGGINTIKLLPPPMWAIWASDGPNVIHNPRYFPDFHHCYLVAMAIKTSGGNSDMVNYINTEMLTGMFGDLSAPLSITIQLAFMEVETTMARFSGTANYSNFSRATPKGAF